MVVVAVAGGTGNLGKALVEVLKDSPKHKVVVLSRKPVENAFPNTAVVVVNYEDVDGTAKLLASNDVHTVISTIRVLDPVSSAAEVSLIRASARSNTIKRFITSSWGILHDEKSPVHQNRQNALNELEKTNLESTSVVNGFFLDYYGMPHVKTYLTPIYMVVDMQNKAAAIPGTGNEPMSFTYTFDVGKFVAALLDLPKWDKVTYCYGDHLTWNEFVKLAEEARGTKFTVAYDSLEKLEKGEVTELPAHRVSDDLYSNKEIIRGMLCLFGRYMIEGRFAMPLDKTLNAKFPEIQTMKAKDMVQLWKGK
ncbi:hypothetical protein F5884DRAFT_345008 [Xylogone sp. PMI_703]|nr:hypothetical protein F5884DRAFT_345008 [Xylogone sp. PMI_703]